MPTIEHQFLSRHTIDGEEELVIVPERYRQDAVMFLPYNRKERRFLFERRVAGNDPLFGKVVVSAGHTQDLGERKFPLWTAERELLEEYGIVAAGVVYLGETMDERRRIRLNGFLMIDTLYGDPINTEPHKRQTVWMPYDEVYRGDVINPTFELATTKWVLQRAREEMRKWGII
jgi:hypothetical protein